MLAVHQTGLTSQKAYVRRFFGFVVATTACGVFAEAYGMLPDPRRSHQILVFAVLGLFWGWLLLGRDPSPARRWKTAGRGALHFSAIGAVGFAVEVFSNLDDAPALNAALSNLGWTMFSGLFAWAICFAATAKDVVPRNVQGGRFDGGSPLAESLWYLLFSVAIVSCIGLVFYSLIQI